MSVQDPPDPQDTIYEWLTSDAGMFFRRRALLESVGVTPPPPTTDESAQRRGDGSDAGEDADPGDDSSDTPEAEPR